MISFVPLIITRHSFRTLSLLPSLLLFSFWLLSSCAPPNKERAEGGAADIIVDSRSFNDHARNNVAVLAAAASAYTLTGTCDIRSTTLEYSYDNSSWTQVPGGCAANGTFSLDVSIANNKLTVFCRAKGTSAYTQNAIANIVLAGPPTNRLTEFASSSRFDSSSGVGVQYSLNNSFGGFKSQNSAFILRRGVVGVMYDH